MSQSLRVATWNIAGARKMRSLDTFDYESQDTDYFADKLAELSPDVVCLQESHTSDKEIIAQAIAEKLGMTFVHNDVVSPSHIDSNYRLGNAIISRLPLVHKTDATYPYPDFANYFADGRPSVPHDKMIQIFEWAGVTIANTQMLPLTIFGHSYDRGEGRQLARQIEKILIKNLRAPLVLCGDLNHDQPAEIYPDLFSSLSLREALPDEMTRPNKENVKKTPDHILVTPECRIVDAKIVPVQADHFLGFADIRVA